MRRTTKFDAIERNVVARVRSASIQVELFERRCRVISLDDLTRTDRGNLGLWSCAGHDPNISYGAPLQCRESCLITRAVMHGDCMLDRIKFNQYSTLRLPILISFRGRATR